MVRQGVIGRCKRRFKVTTTPDPAAGMLAPDLIKRAFSPDAYELDTAWCGDITYVRTWEGWLYLATVIDLASRKVVGFAMADHMRADLVCDALEMALEQRQPEPGVTFHSDRGSQYTGEVVREVVGTLLPAMQEGIESGFVVPPQESGSRLTSSSLSS